MRRHREDLLQPLRPANRGLHLRATGVRVLITRFDRLTEGTDPMTSLPRPAQQATHDDSRPLYAQAASSCASRPITVTVRSQPTLSPQEFRLLTLLLQHVDRVFASQYLLDQLWGPNYTGHPGTLNVHILRLRAKPPIGTRAHSAHVRPCAGRLHLRQHAAAIARLGVPRMSTSPGEASPARPRTTARGTRKISHPNQHEVSEISSTAAGLSSVRLANLEHNCTPCRPIQVLCCAPCAGLRSIP